MFFRSKTSTLRVGSRETEPLCPFVTLSKAGCTVLSKGTHSKTPAASNFREWCKSERKAKNACIF